MDATCRLWSRTCSGSAERPSTTPGERPLPRFPRCCTAHKRKPRSGASSRSIFNSGDRSEPGIFVPPPRSSPGLVPLFTMSGVEGHIFGPMAKSLRLCDRRRPQCHLYRSRRRLSSILLPEKVSEVETRDRARLAPTYYRPPTLALMRFAMGRLILLRSALVVAVVALPSQSRPRIPPEARRGQFLDPRDPAAVGISARQR